MIQNIICTTKNKISESAGGALHVLGLANGFFRAGMNVSLICPDTNLDAARFKFKLFPLACDTGNKFTRLIKFEVKKFIKINGIVRLNRNNNALYMRRGVLHVAEYISSLLYDVPLIIEENDKKPWASLPVHWSGIDWLFELATNILYRRALVIVCVSEGLGRFIVNKYPFVATKTIVVNNGVDEDIFFPLDADECRQKINVPIGYYTIGYVGSLFKQRGVQFIIDAIRILREQRVPVIAIIVGDGAFRRDLQELANKYNVANAIVFAGYQPPRLANVFINAFDCCVLADNCEKVDITISPLKLASYFACRKAVVVPRIPIDLPSDAHGRLCMFFEPESSSSLAETIKSVLFDKNLSKSLADNAFNYVRKGQTWTLAAETILRYANGKANLVS